MGPSAARRVQLTLLALIGLTALVAVILMATGGLGGGGGIRLFGSSAQSRQVGDGAIEPGREADSVAAFTEKYGDPPDATYARLRIPSISVDAPVTYRAVTGDVMPEPSGPTDVAYYDMSRFPGTGGEPGAGGNAIFAGHVDLLREVPYAGNVEYAGPAVFWSLDELTFGDRIEVDYNGSTYVYHVTRVDDLDAETAEWGRVWSNDVEHDTITLFTCGGTFDSDTHEYSHRLVVVAERA